MVEFEEPTDSIGTINAIVKKPKKIVNYAEGKNTRTRNNTRNYGNSKSHTRTNEEKFKGETTALNGHVFQVHAESPKRGQFQDTLDALKIYTSTIYIKDIQNLTTLFTDLVPPVIREPKEPKEKETIDNDGNKVTTAITRLQEAIFGEEIKQYIKESRSLKSTLTSLYNIVWGQCSKLMQNKLLAAQDFNITQENSDVCKLLIAIQGISNQLETNVSIYDALDGAKRAYYLYKQDENESNAMHLKNFKNLISIIEYFGGNIFEDQSLVDHEKKMDIKNNIRAKSEEEYKKVVKDKMMG